MSNRKEGRKWRENTNQKAPDGFSRLEVFEKAATKKDDHNHPNSLQRFSVTVLVKEKTPAMKRNLNKGLYEIRRVTKSNIQPFAEKAEAEIFGG